MTTDAADLLRCAVHPSRPAAGLCPVCERPRCAADVGPRPGCAACGGVAAAARTRRPVTAESVVGAAVACALVTPLAGAIASQYVEVDIFSIAVPAGVGIACGYAAEAGARRARGWQIRVAAVFFALLATAYGFEFEPAGVDPLDLPVTWLPYVAALAGAYAWTAPPARRRRAGSGAASRRRPRSRTGG